VLSQLHDDQEVFLCDGRKKGLRVQGNESGEGNGDRCCRDDVGEGFYVALLGRMYDDLV
jgi:hypothetical protein